MDKLPVDLLSIEQCREAMRIRLGYVAEQSRYQEWFVRDPTTGSILAPFGNEYFATEAAALKNAVPNWPKSKCRETSKLMELSLQEGFQPCFWKDSKGTYCYEYASDDHFKGTCWEEAFCRAWLNWKQSGKETTIE